MTNHETAAPEGTAQEHIPARYRSAQFHTVDDAMPVPWMGELGIWLHSQRGHFRRGGDDGTGRFNYELIEADELYDPMSELKARIAGLLDEAIAGVGIPDFDLEFIECHATLYHHGSHFVWHTDREGYDGSPATTRRLSWCLYMHSEPRMFKGGELEFLDGTKIDSQHNRLVFFDPYQQHRVRRVECWSADFLHGRWALFGWVHGQPPGAEPGAHLEGVPLSG